MAAFVTIALFAAPPIYLGKKRQNWLEMVQHQREKNRSGA
jgi:hypothetical protein